MTTKSLVVEGAPDLASPGSVPRDLALAPWRILLVGPAADSCEPTRGDVLHALLEAGFCTWRAEPDEVTSDEVRERRPAVIVVELAADGPPRTLELLASIRRLGSHAPPVIGVASAGDDGPTFEVAAASGVRTLLQRPVSPAQLRIKVLELAYDGARAARSLGSFGRYLVRSILGSGATGTVYRAWDGVREVALKVLDPYAAESDPETLVRFHRETEILRNLRAPNVPRFFEAGRAGESFYCAMEFVPGTTLERSLETGPLDDVSVARVLVDVSRGLEAIHDAGLVHRDVKPSNVVMARDAATLVDLGLAKHVGDMGLTRTDEVFGTIGYMAPELFAGAPAAPETDAFALGMTALEARFGRLPFEGTTYNVSCLLARGAHPRARAVIPGAAPALVQAIDGLLARADERATLAATRATVAPLLEACR